MNKLVLIGLALFLFSCKRVYQCECTQITNGEDWNAKKLNYPVKGTKKDAESLCKAFDYSNGWDDYQSCKIK